MSARRGKKTKECQMRFGPSRRVPVGAECGDGRSLAPPPSPGADKLEQMEISRFNFLHEVLWILLEMNGREME